jgi:hypothetical protein
MDVGNLKQPFGKSTKKHPLGSGLFKVGDYEDEDVPSTNAPKSHGSFTESIKSEFKKVTGKHSEAPADKAPSTEQK